MRFLFQKPAGWPADSIAGNYRSRIEWASDKDEDDLENEEEEDEEEEEEESKTDDDFNDDDEDDEDLIQTRSPRRASPVPGKRNIFR